MTDRLRAVYFFCVFCYDDRAGLGKLEACVRTIRGGIQAIAMHENLKGTYKVPLRLLAQQLGVPLVKHQALRQPQHLRLW